MSILGVFQVDFNRFFKVPSICSNCVFYFSEKMTWHFMKNTQKITNKKIKLFAAVMIAL